MFQDSRQAARNAALDPEDTFAAARAKALSRRDASAPAAVVVYTILRIAFASLAKKVESYAKRATKLGCQPVALREVSSEWVNRGEGMVEVVTVEITGDKPDTNGWQFVAHLNHTNHAETKEVINVIRRRARREFITEDALEAFRVRGRVCDHCELKRARKDTYVLFNENTKETIQVGSTCLEQFLGFNPSAMLYHFDKESDLVEEIRNSQNLVVDVNDYAIPLTYFALAHVVAKRLNHSQTNQTRWFTGLDYYSLDRVSEAHEDITERDRQAVECFLSYAKEHLADRIESGELSEAQHNMAAIVAAGRVERRHVDLAVSLMDWYRGRLLAARNRSDDNTQQAQSGARTWRFYIKRIHVSKRNGRTYSIVSAKTPGGVRVMFFKPGNAKRDYEIDQLVTVQARAVERKFNKYLNQQETRLELERAA